MENQPNSETNQNVLHKCPHCMCRFCTEADLKTHLKAYGASQAEHASEFQRAHGRLEHGSSNGPE
jgi:hypothetical protein